MRKITFQTFLSGTQARDYIFQKIPYEEQIMQAANMIKEVDYVLMGAGAGLSTAAGAVYGGTWFQENFKEFQERFGNFLNEALKSKKKVLLLELGVGFNTPTIIRFPFEKLVKENKQVNLIRLNLNEAVIQESIEKRAVGINQDIKETIKDLLALSEN